MKLSKVLTVLVAALLCAALVAGCGGVSKKEYEKEMRAASAKAEKQLDELESGQPSPEDIDAAQKSIDKAADDVDDIDAPEEVSKLHDDLVGVLRETAGLMDELGPLMEKASDDPTSLGKEEVDKMNDVTDRFAKIQKDMDRITKGYEKKQYRIGFDTN